MVKGNRLSAMVRQARCSIKVAAIIGFKLSLISCQANLRGELVDELSMRVKSKDARVNIIQIEGEKKVGKIVLEVNSNGYFEVLKDLPKGTYLVEALVPGFNISSKKVVLSDSEKVIIKLHKLENINSKSVIHSHLTIPNGRGEGKASLTPPKL